MSYKNHTVCRACGSRDLSMYLDLGKLPLANNLEPTAIKAFTADRYPLQVMLCNECHLSQLSIVVDPHKLFSNYVYRSAMSAGYVKHCREMAKYLKDKYNLSSSSFVIDIAGNDGTLLKEFKEELELHKLLNIDPAENLCKISWENGVPAKPFFWDMAVSKTVEDTMGKADVITATNVFAHVDNIKEFLEATKYILKEDGVLVLEFPYLVNFIDNREFDTIYFEHLSYFSISPLDRVCKEVGLEIVHVEKIPIHGGSVRVEIQKNGEHLRRYSSVDEFIEKEEEEYQYMAQYIWFANDVNKFIITFKHKLEELKNVAAFAASAKGNTLLNSAGLTADDIRYIVDETPEKIGKFSPGTGIEIVGMERLKADPPNYLLILAWNFQEEIINKVKPFYKGKFIIPIPEFRIIKDIGYSGTTNEGIVLTTG